MTYKLLNQIKPVTLIFKSRGIWSATLVVEDFLPPPEELAFSEETAASPCSHSAPRVRPHGTGRPESACEGTGGKALSSVSAPRKATRSACSSPLSVKPCNSESTNGKP